MSTTAFIIGMIILGLCIVVAALLLSGSISGAAAALKESSPQTLQQPTLSFLTEYDAADYLGISLNELDYIRSEGLLNGAFIAVTSLEQTGEETYHDYEDGVEVTKTRPIMSNVTRFLFNRQLLDEKMMEAIKEGSHINPFRTKNQEKKSGSKKNKQNDNGHAPKKEKEVQKHPVVQIIADDVDEDSEKEKDEVKTEAAPEKESKPAVSKPAPAGPPMPMGPIGDDDDDSDDDDGDDVIDIMARINSAKQNNGGNNNPHRPKNNGGQGKRPNHNGNHGGGNHHNGNNNNH